MREVGPERTIHAIMLALLRRHPVVFYVLVTFSWTWTYVILFLIVFPIPDNPVRTTPGDLLPAAANNEVAPVTALVVAAAVVLFATRGRLGYSAPVAEMTTAPAYSTP